LRKSSATPPNEDPLHEPNPAKDHKPSGAEGR
jgi:hypothetical protein